MSRRAIDLYAIEDRTLRVAFAVLVAIICAAQEARRHLTRPARKTRP